MTKKMFIGDVAVVLLILCLCALFPVIIGGSNESNTVSVSVDGVVTHEISLSENITLSPDGGHTYVSVSDGKAYISDSDCPDGLCMKMKKAGSNGGSVICLPNRVSVSVTEKMNTGGADVAAG